MIKLILYPYAGNPRKLFKELPTGAEISGLLYGSHDVTSPAVEISQSYWDNSYNYARINELNRYYFIERTQLNTDGNLRLYLSCDVLFTYAETIAAWDGFVTYENGGNKFASNRREIYDERPKMLTIDGEITRGGIDLNGTYLIQTLKG